LIETNFGQVKMSELPSLAKMGLLIRTASSNGQTKFSKFTQWVHFDPSHVAEFVDITTMSGHKMSLTGNHLIYTTTCKSPTGEKKVQLANELLTNQCVFVEKDNQLIPTEIISIEKSMKSGIFAPITEEGNLIVDGIWASCYSNVESEGIQKLMFKYISSIFPSALAVEDSTPTSTPHLVYAFLEIAKSIIA